MDRSFDSTDADQTEAKWMSLDDFIYYKGYLQGVGSDVVVKAFGKSYSLHRLILSRSSYFRLLFSSQWTDGSNSVSLSFDGDDNITVDAFETVLQLLYGKEVELEASSSYGQVFAMAKFLDLPEIEERCSDKMIKALSKATIVDTAHFCCANDYGLAHSRLYDACISFLCTDGYEMQELLGELPDKILGEVLTSNAMFVPTEWARCQLVLRLYREEEEKEKEEEEDKEEDKEEEKEEEKEEDKEEDKEGKKEGKEGKKDKGKRRQLLLDILNHEIHLCHLSYRQLRVLELQESTTGQRQPLFERQTLREALWLQMSLREQVLGCPRTNNEIGVAQDWNGDSRLYPIPGEDATQSSDKKTLDQDQARTGSVFPPFRFSVQFHNVAQTPLDTRIYSEPVWYAGSYWSLYVQKLAFKTGYQLGIYLHRSQVDSEGRVMRAAKQTPNLATVFGQQSTMFGPHANRGAQTFTFGGHNQAAYAEHRYEPGVFGTPHSPLLAATPTPAPRLIRPDLNGTEPWGVAAADTVDDEDDTVVHMETLSLDTSTPFVSSTPAVLSRPDYVDRRPNVCAYFEIHTPRRARTAMTTYSSRPDVFDFSQSWGWKSASLGAYSERHRNSALKFMVVLGAL